MGREWVAEGLGTAMLLYVIVGSGIAAERLGGDQAVQLFAHAVIVGLGLAALIALFQTVSGSHFNPSVTLGFLGTDAVDARRAIVFIAAQVIGAVVGVVAANLTFDIDPLGISATARDGLGLIGAEFVATFVLVLAILALVRTGRSRAVPAVVGAWVAAIVFATSSTGFANPALTLDRIFTDSYTGIAPASVAGFLAAQLVAGVVAVPVAKFLYPTSALMEAST
jgi:glycerol uptake facilitator-like aquaporin